MNNLQLFINDQLADLSDDSPIALTFQINNLAEVKNQQGNTSNQFKLPLTQRNRQILGFPDDVAFTTDQPYDNYAAKIVQDGMEIVPYGIAVLNGIEQDSASITVLSGNVDFFDALAGKLYDMGDSLSPYGAKQPFAPYAHNWTVANVVQSQTKTEGWIWPVIDYGNLVYNATGDNEIDVRNLRPGFFIKTAIDLIVKATGYKATGSLLSNPLYPLLIAQFSNDSFEHGTDYQNHLDDLSAILLKATNQPINPNKNSAQTGVITFSGVDATNLLLFQSNTYKAISTVTLAVEFKYGIQVTDTTPNGGSEPYIEIRIIKYSNGSSSVIANLQHHATDRANNSIGVLGHDGKPVDYLKQKQNVEVVLQAGESIGVEFYLWPNKSRIKGTFYGGATLGLTNKQTNVVYGQAVQCERIFPNISQKDLLKDTLQRFGIICQTDSATRTVNFASFRDILDNIPVAKNWTSKCLDQGKAISFQLGGYAQINYLNYKGDDSILPKGLGNAQINVTDKTLPATAVLFESQFAPTLNRPYTGGSIAQIKMADSTDNNAEFSSSVSPRILVNKTIELRSINSRTIKFTDGTPAHDLFVNDVVSVPYFFNSGEPNSLLWDDLRKAYYPELEKILQQTKKMSRYFLLSPRDILDLDLLIPVYLEQDSAYYYINKIESWRKGQQVKVELVKLG